MPCRLFFMFATVQPPANTLCQVVEQNPPVSAVAGEIGKGLSAVELVMGEDDRCVVSGSQGDEELSDAVCRNLRLGAYTERIFNPLKTCLGS